MHYETARILDNRWIEMRCINYDKVIIVYMVLNTPLEISYFPSLLVLVKNNSENNFISQIYEYYAA